MSGIRSKNTVAERIVFSYLRKQKLYFQKHYRKATGTPDIALPRKKKAIFIDSAFWHGKNFKELRDAGKLSEFWIEKISMNMNRDQVQRERLLSAGWQIKIVWEDDLKRKSTKEATLEDIKQFLIA